MFKREVEPNEKTSTGVIKNWVKECYIGQSKDLIKRIAQHYLQYDHLGISLKKHDNWKIFATFVSAENLDEQEKYTIDRARTLTDVYLFNVSGGGQNKQRTSHINEKMVSSNIKRKESFYNAGVSRVLKLLSYCTVNACSGVINKRKFNELQELIKNHKKVGK
jgi:hypothetical protein